MQIDSEETLLFRIEDLESRLAESEQLIEAIKAGEVDAFAVNKNNQHEVYTLQSADYAYRVLIENIGEGALNLTEEGLIVYSNTYFNSLVNVAPGKILGNQIFDFIHPDSKERFCTLLKQGFQERSRGEIKLLIDEETIPVYVSLTSLSPQLPTVGMIISNLTEEKKKKEATRKYQEEVVLRERIEESEKKYRQLVTGLPVALYTCNADGYIVLYNDAAVELWGQEPEIGKDKWCGSFHIYKTDGTKISLDECPMAIALKEGRIVQFEVIIERPDGTRRSVMPNPQPIFDNQGKITGAVNMLLDITETKKAEEVNAKLAAIVQSSEDAIISKTTEGIVTSWNPGAKKLFGYDAEEMIGQPIIRLIPADRLNEETKILDKIKRGKSVEHFETKRLTKSGKLINISLTISPVKDKNGNITGASKIARDITEEVEARELLKENEKRFRELAEAMPQIVWTAKPDGAVDYFNKQWYEFTGLEEHTDYPVPPTLMHADDQQRNREAYYHAIKTGEPYQVEFRFADRKNPGSYIWFMGRANPVRDEQGNIVKWFGTCTNIDDTKRIQEQLQLDKKRREDFIKMASHELKTPITTIKGHVQLMLGLLKDGPNEVLLPADVESSLVTMNNQVNRLTRLISEMLDQSRIEAGELELRKESFNLNKLVIETVQDILYTNSHCDIEIAHDFECRVFADKDRIGQAVSNLLTNAIKYSPHSNRVEVRIYQYAENKVAVSVKDFGIGIDEKEKEKIFGRFYRVTGSSEQTYPGFGVGLYITHEIMQRHGGKIIVESKKGKGSTFILILAIEH